MWVGGRRRRRRRHRIPPHHDSSPPSYACNSTEVDRVQTMRTTTIRRTSTCNHHTSSKYWILLASSAFFALITQNVASDSGMMLPTWRAQHSATGMARNIRHLPCVSRRTGETGLCMFAYSCAKANGTHLGTCIDRFYFGSCCKLPANSDPEVAEPLNNNFLNKEDVGSVTKRPAFLPDFTAISSTYPSTSGLPSSLADLFTSSTTFIKTTGSGTSASGSSSTMKPSSMHTISSLSFETTPITSRTPLVNVTLSQSYSTPLSHVTTSPLIYSTTVSTVFQGSSPRPAGVSSTTTGYSKPLTKPTPKPNKTKPPVSGKPGSSKPKPTKLPPKPGTATSATFPNRTTSFTATTGLSSSSSSSRPTYVSDTTVPTRLPSRPSTQSVPTPITLFTSSKRPSKPTKTPSTAVYTTTASAPPSSYVKIPVSTVGQNKPTTSIPSVSSSPYPSSNTDDFFSRFNTTVSSSTSLGTERPLRPWQTSSVVSWTSGSTSSSTPSSSSSTYTTGASSTASQPSLVTWTTIEEIPAVILPDRTKPTSMVKPSGKPQVTRPTFFPTFSKPISSTEKTTSRPDLFKPASKPEPDYTTRAPTTSPSWVEVSVTTHAPTASVPSTSSEPPEDITVNVISHSTAKPSTSITIPVSSPLPLQTTSSPSIDPSGVVNMSDYRDVCGRRLFPTARIVGGEKATFGKWPWQISLRQWRTSTYLHKCGAALFNENWAVTAAHCVENVSPSDLLLRLGEHDLAVEDEPYGYQERRVPFVASHPQFDPRTFEYDLALLRFDEPVKFQPNIIPICVPEDDTNFVGSEAFVTGWGRLYEDGPLPSVLQEVSVPVINNSVCENMYQAAGYIEHIPNIFICAGWKKGGFDSCEGDSGGPMVIQRPDRRWLLAGIISWGIGCAEPNQPGVYTRISEFRDWINQILQY